MESLDAHHREGVCVFPEDLKGYMLMKKSNIPIEEHRQILTAAHLSYRFDDLAKAMRSQYDGRLVRNKGNRRDETDHRRTRRQHAFQTEDDKEIDQDDEGNEDDEEDDEDESDESLENAIATYMRPKRALMDKKKNRGFFNGDKNGSIEEKKKRSKCARCGEKGHWAHVQEWVPSATGEATRSGWRQQGQQEGRDVLRGLHRRMRAP